MAASKSVLQLLCPFGTFTHAKGVQLVDEEATRRMLREFDTAMRRLFKRGLPVYMGHPDEGANPRRARKIGSIEHLVQTQGGIAASIRYEDRALEKIMRGEIKGLSPRWLTEPLGGGVYRPVRLISAGLTDNPNIPGCGAVLKPQDETSARALRECVLKAKEISEGIKGALKSAAQSATEPRGDKPQSAPLARGKNNMALLAKERMEITGEPYSKCFAAVRKEFLI